MTVPPFHASAVLVTVAALTLIQADERLVRTSDPLGPEEERKTFQLPEGFEVTCFAAEPLIHKPINLAFDDRNRLWVSSTTEYPYAADRSRWSDPEGSFVRGSRDAIKILEDRDGDGRADKVTVFADGLNIPTGVLPWHQPDHHDGCIAWSIPNIWYLADTTGDGICDHLEVLFGPLGYEKDTHGMCSSFRLGQDGWIYATHGFNNTSTLRAKDGTGITLQSGNVFRFRPDASSVEVWSHGQVNPFGLAFDRRGNLYSADCHSAPVYQLLQGAVYPSFGKPHDGLGFGPTMIEHTHGSTGICGIAYVDRDRWGGDWNDHVLIGNVVTSRINHDRIEYRGSTPVAVEQPDFLVSGDPWFRPVDLCQGEDGALYVADFYNRIIGHYEVPLDHPGRDRERGRIWRITRAGKSRSPSPRKPAEPSPSPARALLDASPFAKRRAANQLQNAPRLEALRPLLHTLRETLPDDTHLRHALRLAIREHLKLPRAFSALEESDAEEIASITPAVPTAEAAAYLASQPHPSRESIVHIARHGSEETLRQWIQRMREEEAIPRQALAIDALQEGLDERGRAEIFPELIDWATALAWSLLDEKERTGPSGWVSLPHPETTNHELPWALQPRHCEDGREAVVLSSLRRGERGAEQRTGILQSLAFPAPASLTFWICGHRGPPSQPAHERNVVYLIDAGGRELQRAYPPRHDTCRRITWEIPSTAQGKPVRLQVIDGDTGNSYAWLGITRIEPEVAEVTSYAASQQLDRNLGRLAGMLKLSAPARLRERLKPWLPLPSPGQAPHPVTAEERERIEQLIRRRSLGFAKASPVATRGSEVFRQHCASCHQIGREGSLIGPQLDGIGTRGIDRLLEDILDPNRNVDAHFHLSHLTLRDGSTATGNMVAERGELVQLRDALGQLQRVPRGEIVSRETHPLSLMPSVFGDTLPEAELYHLLAFLQEQK